MIRLSSKALKRHQRHIDVAVIGIAHESVAAPLKFPIHLIDRQIYTA